MGAVPKAEFGGKANRGSVRLHYNLSVNSCGGQLYCRLLRLSAKC